MNFAPIRICSVFRLTLECCDLIFKGMIPTENKRSIYLFTLEVSYADGISNRKELFHYIASDTKNIQIQATFRLEQMVNMEQPPFSPLISRETDPDIYIYS